MKQKNGIFLDNPPIDFIKTFYWYFICVNKFQWRKIYCKTIFQIYMTNNVGAIEEIEVHLLYITEWILREIQIDILFIY